MQYIHPTAQIGKHVTIEDDVYIGPFCIIGFPAEWKGMEGIDKGVLIKSGSRLTGHVTVDSGAVRQTEIGKNCYLMKHSYVAHDCIIQDEVTLSAGAKVAGHCIIGTGTNIGMNATIHQRQQIAQGCMIGMSAVITKGLETKENSKYVGNPARYLSKNK